MKLINRRNNEGYLINVFIAIISIISFLFIIVFNIYFNNNIGKYLFNIIFINESSNYYNYLYLSIGYILVTMILSTSYLGFPIVSWLVSFRIYLIINSFIYLFDTNITIYILFVLIIPQLILEILITYLISLVSIKLSYESFYITFISRNNIKLKKTLNIILNFLIITLILLTISMLIKTYLI